MQRKLSKITFWIIFLPRRLFWNSKDMIDNAESTDHGYPNRLKVIQNWRIISNSCNWLRTIWATMKLNIKFFLLHLQARRTVQQLAVTFFPPILVLVQPVVRLQWWIKLCYTVKTVAGVQHTEARDIMNFRSSIYFGPDDAKIYPLKLHRNYQILS